jgi:hypothetical protein
MKKLSARVYSRAHLPQLQLAAVEMAHRVAADRRHRGKHVVAAAVDLLLLMVEGVDRARPDLAEADVDRRRVDRKRLVRQPREARVGLAGRPEDGQIGQRRAVMVELGLLFGRRLGDAGRAGERAVEMVEAAVLGIDHDDGRDPGERIVGRGRLGEREDRGADESEHADFHLVPLTHTAIRTLYRSRDAPVTVRGCLDARYRGIRGQIRPQPRTTVGPDA